MKISPKKSPSLSKKNIGKRADKIFSNAKISCSLKQVDITNMLKVKNEFDKDDHNIKFGSKVRQSIKNYENNFVDKSPVKPESTRVVIERNLENKSCGFKNAFEAIMKSGGGDTPH